MVAVGVEEISPYSSQEMAAKHPDSMMALYPGRQLGMFKLGDSLYSVLNELKYRPIISTSSVTVHGESNDCNSSITAPIIVRLNPSTIDLHFEGTTQRLSTMTMSLPSISFDLTYENDIIVPRNDALSRTTAGQLFGPCRSENLDSWPGMLWTFNNGQSTSVTISSTPTPTLEGQLSRVYVIPHDSVLFNFTNDSPEIEIKLGVSHSTDVVSAFGPPESTFEKRDRRLEVYAGSDASDLARGVFYNYPALGFDVMLNTVTHKVEKLILHSNVPATPLFQAYNRCPWQINLTKELSQPMGTASSQETNGSTNSQQSNGSNNKQTKRNKHNKVSNGEKVDVKVGEVQETSITFVDKIDSVIAKLNKNVQIDKMVLDRAHEVGLKEWNEDMGMMELVSFDVLGVIMEVTKSGDVASLCIHDRK
ncbi:hypothetical protein E3Q23_01872 [Wallemia mellicola]|nr:hypothetical protein E3Q23_01872 [Wallemia mellicola]TIC11628.1 hypothetical protein E3Q14_02173 [Wallemia mellicola]TIC13793.1 hypothetical protein E3Q15_01895 [Wallemia mellicola]TIC57525.1 hypothetical protein E3Q05_01199 [Wallemia mellicola]